MAPKYGEHKLDAKHGFTGSAGRVSVKPHHRAPPARMKKADGGRINSALQTVPDNQINQEYGVAGKKVPPGYRHGGKIKKAEGGDVQSSTGAAMTADEEKALSKSKMDRDDMTMKEYLKKHPDENFGRIIPPKPNKDPKPFLGFKKGGMPTTKTAVHKHERHLHPGSPLTKLNKGGFSRSPKVGK